MLSSASLVRHPALRRPVLLGATCALLTQTACYSYRPVVPAQLAPGGDLHLGLTRVGSAELQSLLGPDVRRINGQVQEMVGDTALVMLVDEVVTGDGNALAWRRGRVTVPLRTVSSIDLRALDRRRTKTFAIVATTTFIAVVVAAIKRAGYRGSSRSGSGSGPPE